MASNCSKVHGVVSLELKHIESFTDVNPEQNIIQ